MIAPHGGHVMNHTWDKNSCSLKRASLLQRLRHCRLWFRLIMAVALALHAGVCQHNLAALPIVSDDERTRSKITQGKRVCAGGSAT